MIEYEIVPFPMSTGACEAIRISPSGRRDFLLNGPFISIEHAQETIRRIHAPDRYDDYVRLS